MSLRRNSIKKLYRQHIPLKENQDIAKEDRLSYNTKQSITAASEEFFVGGQGQNFTNYKP